MRASSLLGIATLFSAALMSIAGTSCGTTTAAPDGGAGAGGYSGEDPGNGGNVQVSGGGGNPGSGASGAPNTGSGGGSSVGAGGATSGASGSGSSAGGSSGGAPDPVGGAGGSGEGGAAVGGEGGAAVGGDSGAGGDGAGGDGGALAPVLPPPQGALLGAHVGTGSLAELEATLGRKLAVVHKFYAWSDDWPTWVRATLQGGQIPLVTWETWTGGVGIPFDDILAGTHDAMIRTRAQAAKAIGRRFFLRWGHEMNGNWYPWDGTHNGANAAATAKFVSVYRHLHDLFVAEGAANVLWVFCPNFESVPSAAWNQWASYYPGDAYVDWMGFDGYNRGTSEAGSTWRTFTQVTGTIYAGLAAKGKPIVIAETASTEVGGDKAAWIRALLPALRGSYPAVKALVWFHMNKSTDWRVDSSTAARTAFVAMANDTYFNP